MLGSPASLLLCSPPSLESLPERNLSLGALILAWPESLEEEAALALPFQTIPG